MSNPSITAVVPFKNSRAFLERTGENLVRAAVAHGSVEVILVDNGSTDGSRLVAEKIAGRTGGSVVSAPYVNVGALRNLGAAAGRGAILSFIDSDCLVPGDYFLRLEEVLQTSGAHAVGSRYTLPDAPGWIEAAWDGLHKMRRVASPKFINAGNFACERETLEAVGGFDPDLESGEDAELCARLRRLGYSLHEDPSLVAVHLGNPKTMSQFVKKHRWHAQGQFGTLRHGVLNLPLLGTVSYLASWLMVPWIIMAAGWFGFVIALLVVNLVPASSVVYRWLQTGEPAYMLQGFLLYHLYFIARLLGLKDLLLKRS